MPFTSLKFLIFLAIIVLVKYFAYNKISSRTYTVFLLICNYVFYSCFDIRFSLLLILLTIVVYYCALRINKKIYYYFGIFFSITILCFFKYFNFFIDKTNIISLNVIVPIGISFYTFEAISYLIDVKRSVLPPEKDFIVFAAYLSFFANITSGPIIRANRLITQIKDNKKIVINDITTGIQLIAIGFFKKMVIADRLSVFVNDVFTRPTAFNWYTTLLAIFSYSIQIYMDFSGYSDIAIGCAKCLGYNLDKNFDLPYISCSITEFWRRWHISLSSWFRDYVYIPLGGNKKGIYKQLINILIVMTLSGLWHGSSLNYVAWGFINGILLCIEKILIKNKKSNFFRCIITFILISFTWVFFRADNIQTAFEIFKSVFSFQNGINQLYLWSFVYTIISIIYTLIIIKRNGKQYSNYFLFDLSTISGLTLFLIEIGLIICFAYTNTSAFVYFQF